MMEVYSIAGTDRHGFAVWWTGKDWSPDPRKRMEFDSRQAVDDHARLILAETSDQKWPI